MNRNYNRGVAFERKIIEQLKQKGYRAARSAGSHGCFDVIAWNDSEIIFIQCKTTIKDKSYDSIYKKEIEEIKSEIVPHNGKKELWIKCGRKVTIIDLTSENMSKKI